MARWQFMRRAIDGPEQWSWRLIGVDNAVKLESKQNLPGMRAAMLDATQFGFNEDRHQWSVENFSNGSKKALARIVQDGPEGS